jgi:hypothetical protein
MESRTLHITATGDGFIVRRSRIQRPEPGVYSRDDTSHPVATDTELLPHLEWLRPEPAGEVVPMRRGRRAANSGAAP